MRVLSRTSRDRPLDGRRVIVTRAAERAAPLVRALEAQGAEVVVHPVIRVVGPPDPSPLREAARSLDAYDRVVFTSVHGVRALTEAVRAAGPVPGDPPVACAGAATAGAATEAGWTVDIVPGTAGAEALVAALVGRAGSGRGLAGSRVLFPRAEDARPTVVEGLRAAGAEVQDVVAYRKVLPEAATGAAGEAPRISSTDILTFTSPSTVRNFFELFDAGGGARAAAAVVIGPTTARVYEEITGRAATAADRATVDGLVEAVVRVAGRRRH